jgi:preprotein translocase subunit SecD
MLGRSTRLAGSAITALVLVLATATCTGSEDPGTSDSPSVEPAAFQLRPVEKVLDPPSNEWRTSEVTCPGEQWERCLADARAGQVVVRGVGREKYVLGPVMVDGGDVVEARAIHEPMSKGWSVSLQLSTAASDALASATMAAAGSRLAMVVDGHVVSAPTVNAPITSGAVVIAGGLSESAAKRIAASLGG